MSASRPRWLPLLDPEQIAELVEEAATLGLRVDGVPVLRLDHSVDAYGDAAPLPAPGGEWVYVLEGDAGVEIVMALTAALAGRPPRRRAAREAAALLAGRCRLATRPPWTFRHPTEHRRVVALVRALSKLLPLGTTWRGTCSELVAALGPPPPRRGGWPRQPRVLSMRLRAARIPLAVFGFSLAFRQEGHARQRVVTIRRERAHEPLPSLPAPGRRT